MDAFTDLAQLASRITQHLAKNPNDQQARDDLKYVTSKLGSSATAANAQDQSDANGPSDPHPGYSIAAGLGQAAADIPKGVGQALLHPIQTIGQMTGLGNVGHMVDVANDPNAGIGEKLAAVIQATPLNMGYAPERALLDATGATSDTPAPLEEQAHRAGNVASLALLGAKPGAVVKPLMSGVSRMVGSGLLGKTLSAAVNDRAPTEVPGFTRFGEPPEPTPPKPQAPKGPTNGPPPTIDPAIAGRADVRSALADYQAGRMDRAGLETALEYATQDQQFTAGRQPGSPALGRAAADVIPARSGAAPMQGQPQTTAGLPLDPASVTGATPPATPGLRPGEAAAPIPGTNGQGIAVTGTRATPAPPTTPTILEMQEGQPPQAWMDQAAKLGASPEAARQSWLTKTPLDQLPGLSDAQRQGLTDFANKEIAVTKETMARPQRGATQGQLAYRQNAVKSVGSAVRSPIYQNADVIAKRIVSDPQIQQEFPAYQGLDQNAARTLLLQQLVKNAQAGNTVPELTSVESFLRRLAR